MRDGLQRAVCPWRRARPVAVLCFFCGARNGGRCLCPRREFEHAGARAASLQRCLPPSRGRPLGSALSLTCTTATVAIVRVDFHTPSSFTLRRRFPAPAAEASTASTWYRLFLASTPANTTITGTVKFTTAIPRAPSTRSWSSTRARSVPPLTFPLQWWASTRIPNRHLRVRDASGPRSSEWRLRREVPRRA